jgi:hypothetical protein
MLESAWALVALVAVVALAAGVVTWAGRSRPPAPDDAAPQPSVSRLACSSVATYVPPTPSGTAPATLPQAAFGAYAVQDLNYVPWTGAQGRAVYNVYPNLPTSWGIFSFTYAYATDQVAAQAVADRVAARLCNGATAVEPAGGSAVPGAVYLHGRSAGGSGGGLWIVLVRVGAHVMSFEAQASNEPPTGGPGDAFLVGVAAAAHRVMTGGAPGTIPLPDPQPTTAPAPAGFPAPSELGDGWSLGADPQDHGSVQTSTVPGPGCDGVKVAAAHTGSYVTYRGHQPQGNQEWLLTESVVTLTPTGRTQALEALRQAGSGCTRTKALLSGASVAGDYAYAERPVTDAGAATMYVLSGDQLIVLTTLPGGAMGQDVPLPGDVDWLTTTARLAVDRAASG